MALQYKLKDASIEQKDILENLATKNIIIDAVAGSGKTTTILHAVKFLKETNISDVKQHPIRVLILTFNKKLRQETNEKLESLNSQGIINKQFVEIHTYHSFCVKYYDEACFTDIIMRKIIDQKRVLKAPYKFDMFILDEAQDMNKNYYELVCKIIIDQKHIPKFLLLGDKNQSIYDFNRSDQRYITCADKLFDLKLLNTKIKNIIDKDNNKINNTDNKINNTDNKINNTDNKPDNTDNKIDNTDENAKNAVIVNTDAENAIRLWAFKKLSVSFRLTSTMAKFINNCVLNEERIFASDNKIGLSVDYIICDSYKVKYIQELVRENVRAYGIGEVFILAPSVKSDNSPVKILANYLSAAGLPLFVPNTDDEKIDPDVLTGKLVFSTFHQVKGLERKCVFIIGFDYGYIQYYRANKLFCSNPLYVALTRAQDKLILIHNYKQKYLPYINRKKLPLYANVINITNTKFPEDDVIKPTEPFEAFRTQSVEDFLRYLPSDILTTAYEMLKFELIQPADYKIPLASKIEQDKLFEVVSDINSVAVISYYEYKSNAKMKIHEILTDAEKVSTALNNPSIADTLNYANKYLAHINKYIYKLNQVKSNDWISTELMDMCMRRLEKITKSAEYFVRLENTYLYGNCSCVVNAQDAYNAHNTQDTENVQPDKNEIPAEFTGRSLWQIKCVEELKLDHFLQLACYTWIDLWNGRANNKYIPTNYYLFNIIDNKIYKIIYSPELIDTLFDVVMFIYREKAKINDKLADHKFLEENINAVNALITGGSNKSLICEKCAKQYKLKSAYEKHILICGQQTENAKYLKFPDIIGKKIFVFDLETTGLPKKLKKSAKQYNELYGGYYPETNNAEYDSARILSIGWWSTQNFQKNINLEEIKINEYFRKPEDFTEIPEDSIRVHGITFEIASRGELLADIVNKFWQELRTADYIIGHNIMFDVCVLMNELSRLNNLETAKNKFADELTYLKNNLAKCLCTMQYGTEICKIKSKGNKLKKPTLSELYMHYYKKMPTAHIASEDVKSVVSILTKL